MITKNSVMKFQNLIENHEPPPVKSNPEMIPTKNPKNQKLSFALVFQL